MTTNEQEEKALKEQKQQEEKSLKDNWPLIQGELARQYPELTTKDLGHDSPDIKGIAKATGLDEDQVKVALAEFAWKYRNSDPAALSTNPDNLKDNSTARTRDSGSDTHK